MRIWIVNPYGTLPSEGWREYRSAMLARALHKRGHEVIWWIADFEHRSKKFRQHRTTDEVLPIGIEIQCLSTKAYSKHVGLARIAFEKSFGREFAKISITKKSPDAIVIAEPALFFGVPVRKYAEKFNIPIIVDVIDLWPELFHILLPHPLRWLGKLIFAPLYRRRKKLVSQAKGVVAVAGNYRDASMVGQLPKTTGIIYWGVDIDLFRRAEEENATPDLFKSWSLEYDGLTVVYAGTLGAAYDMDTVYDAVRQLCMLRDSRIRFIFAGDGPLKAKINELSLEYPQKVAFLGSMSAEKLIPYYINSDIGLCSYAKGSTVSMPIKVFDYIAAGLGVANSLQGEIKMLVANGCGIQYEPGSVNSLVTELVNLEINKHSIKSMKEKSKELAVKFDIPYQYSAFVGLIEKVIADGV